MRLIRQITSLALAAGLSAGCGGPKDPGERVWKRKCAACHGTDGAGRTRFAETRPFADLTDGKWRHVPDRATLRKLVAEGDPRSTMPPFEGTLTPAEIDAVVDHALKLAAGRPGGTRP
jgi:mono/diheme cytochrome c family protein